jgi:hypothetical protein
MDKSKLVSDTPSRTSRKKGITVFKENPFWDPTEVRVGTKMIRVAGGRHISEDGEEITHSGVHLIKHVDKEEFVKLYTKNMKVFFDLKPTSQKLLQSVLGFVQKNPGCDAIYLHWFEVDAYMKANELKMSKASFHNAMREMLGKGFLAESEAPNQYWINPHLFFNGDRMTFINEFRIKATSKAHEPERAQAETGDGHSNP